MPIRAAVNQVAAPLPALLTAAELAEVVLGRLDHAHDQIDEDFCYCISQVVGPRITREDGGGVAVSFTVTAKITKADWQEIIKARLQSKA